MVSAAGSGERRDLTVMYAPLPPCQMASTQFHHPRVAVVSESRLSNSKIAPSPGKMSREVPESMTSLLSLWTPYSWTIAPAFHCSEPRAPIRASRSTERSSKSPRRFPPIAKRHVHAVPQAAAREQRRHFAQLEHRFAAELGGRREVDRTAVEAHHLDRRTERDAALVGDADGNRRDDARDLRDDNIDAQARGGLNRSDGDGAEDAQLLQPDDVLIGRALIVELALTSLDLPGDERLVDLLESRDC